MGTRKTPSPASPALRLPLLPTWHCVWAACWAAGVLGWWRALGVLQGPPCPAGPQGAHRGPGTPLPEVPWHPRALARARRACPAPSARRPGPGLPAAGAVTLFSRFVPAIVKQCSVKAWISLRPTPNSAKKTGTHPAHPPPPPSPPATWAWWQGWAAGAPRTLPFGQGTFGPAGGRLGQARLSPGGVGQLTRPPAGRDGPGDPRCSPCPGAPGGCRREAPSGRRVLWASGPWLTSRGRGSPGARRS